MRTIGLITEYNPLHNGHKLQIDLARSKFHADCVIVAMSGNFTQRGDPAVLDKTIRAQMAIECGADAVIEIPCCFATSSLDNFAMGAVALLNSIPQVDNILFGSESGDIEIIQKIANVMQDREKFKILRRGMSTGLSNDDLAQLQLDEQLTCDEIKKISDVIVQPNNILGILYTYNLIKQKSKIVPLTHQRVGQEYLDESESMGVFVSASSIRKSIEEKGLSDYVFRGVPGEVHKYYTASQKYAFFSQLLSLRFEHTMKNENCLQVYEFSDEHISIDEDGNIELDCACTSKMKRSVLHWFLDITNDEMLLICSDLKCVYLNILACNNREMKNCLLNLGEISTDVKGVCLQRDINERAERLYSVLRET